MKLLADENMPFVQELFGDWAEVVTCPGREIKPEQLRDVDVLLVRSITRVDEALLAQAERLSFVGTATIGCDHIDTELLARRGIAFASAPGCNKVAVGDYVLAALLRGGGEEDAAARLSSADVSPGAAARAVAEAFRLGLAA